MCTKCNSTNRYAITRDVNIGAQSSIIKFGTCQIVEQQRRSEALANAQTCQSLRSMHIMGMTVEKVSD